MPVVDAIIVRKAPPGFLLDSYGHTTDDGIEYQIMRIKVSEGGIYECTVMAGDEVWYLNRVTPRPNYEQTSPSYKPESNSSPPPNPLSAIWTGWFTKLFAFLTRYFHWT